MRQELWNVLVPILKVAPSTCNMHVLITRPARSWNLKPNIKQASFNPLIPSHTDLQVRQQTVYWTQSQAFWVKRKEIRTVTCLSSLGLQKFTLKMFSILCVCKIKSLRSKIVEHSEWFSCAVVEKGCWKFWKPCWLFQLRRCLRLRVLEDCLFLWWF